MLYLISNRGLYGFVEELDADDWEQADAHGQNDGQPQVRLPEGIGGHTCQATQHSQCSDLYNHWLPGFHRGSNGEDRLATSELTSKCECWREEDMYSCTVNVKHDSKVDGYTAQNSKTVHKSPVGCVQGYLWEENTESSSSSSLLLLLPTLQK